MTIQDIVNEILKYGDQYMTERYELIPVGMEPVKKHKNKRIQKKYIKKYGMKTKYEEKKVKALDVTFDLILDFCQEKGLPLPVEMLEMSALNNQHCEEER